MDAYRRRQVNSEEKPKRSPPYCTYTTHLRSENGAKYPLEIVDSLAGCKELGKEGARKREKGEGVTSGAGGSR